MKLYKETPEDIEEVVNLLKKSEPLVLPTETVYGLCARASDDVGIKKVFALKDRPLTVPLTLVISDIDQLKKLVKKPNNEQKKLMEAFWPGALTILFDKSKHVSNLCTAGLSNVGVRLTSHPVLREIIKKVGEPLVAPSANLHGKLASGNIGEVIEQLSGRGLQAALNVPCMNQRESTIVEVEKNKGLIVRSGEVGMDALSQVMGGEYTWELREKGIPS